MSQELSAGSGQREDVMGKVISATSPVPSHMRSLSGPIVHSVSLQKFCAKVTSAELRQSLAEARARPPQPWSIRQALRDGWQRCSIAQALVLHLRSATLRSALRWPGLEALIPTVRRRGQMAALFDRVQIESGGVLSASDPVAAVRRLKSYREEWDQIVVWRQPASAGTQVNAGGGK